MNVLTILRSVEELLYEVMSWLLFYPRTLMMTLSHPLRTMKYSDSEQHDKPEKQYLETLSPPLFLVLSILLAHGIEMAFGFRVEDGHTIVGRVVTGSDQNLLVFRALMFSLSPLLFAWLYLKLSKKKIDRDTLRAPFFAQCYLSGATSIVVSVAALGVRDPRLWTTVLGLVVVGALTVWYVAIQHLWLMQIPGMQRWRAWMWSAGTFGAASGLVGVANMLAS
ncbi:MAG: hypothetical protein EON89_09920 [Brevundimonas sp.]|nr:MAG: hypothetical protein EON89_09920 [Brevundimonas sp.]